MIREIKFRGKDIETGEWLVGDLIQRIGYMPAILFPYESNGKVCYAECAVKRETVGQYTGLKDKNGVDIYEGDIVKVITFGFNTETFITEIKYGCHRDTLGFYLANGRSLFYFGQSDYSRLDDTIVIGNIYDNPELLKMEK